VEESIMSATLALKDKREETVIKVPASGKGDPAWALALLFPRQGDWSEAEYLALETNQLVELVDGCLEVLPMPTVFHQRIVKWLFEVLNAFVTATTVGEVFFAPLRVRLFPRHIREPDVVYLRPERITGLRTPPRGADLLMEVVSEGKANRKRDYQKKRQAYQKAGVREYWIVDPQDRRITVLTLVNDAYQLHGEFEVGQQATSSMFPGFAVDVAAVFAAGEGKIRRSEKKRTPGRKNAKRKAD
jgi:Uma2 family endonuclease